MSDRSRRAIRRQLRAARRALTPVQQRDHAERLVRLLSGSLRFRQAKRIAFYWPTDGELDPRQLLQRTPGKQWHLPVLHPFPHRTLGFVRWRPGEPLRPNRFGIPEPMLRGHHFRHAADLDLVLMPLVGFDDAGNRLGMGSGYYDRTLAFLHRRSHWRRPRLIGLAHACQRLDRISPRAWDVPLDAILTEEGKWGHI